jgi:hypothetical protein
MHVSEKLNTKIGSVHSLSNSDIATFHLAILIFLTCRNEDDGCQFVEAAVRGVHFPPVRARDTPTPARCPRENRSATQRYGRQQVLLFYEYKNGLA